MIDPSLLTPETRLYLRPIWFAESPVGLDGRTARMGSGLIWFQGYEVTARHDGVIQRDRVAVAEFDDWCGLVIEPLAVRARTLAAGAQPQHDVSVGERVHAGLRGVGRPALQQVLEQRVDLHVHHAQAPVQRGRVEALQAVSQPRARIARLRTLYLGGGRGSWRGLRPRAPRPAGRAGKAYPTNVTNPHAARERGRDMSMAEAKLRRPAEPNRGAGSSA